MSVVDAAIRSSHLLFAAVWVGAVVFVTVGVLPVAREGEANAAPLERIFARLRTTSRVSALALFLTGGHMAGTGYTTETLTGTTRGHLVLAMLGLWMVLAALVEVGVGRSIDAFQDMKVREPARNYRGLFWGASLAGILLLVVAGAFAWV